MGSKIFVLSRLSNGRDRPLNGSATCTRCGDLAHEVLVHLDAVRQRVQNSCGSVGGPLQSMHHMRQHVVLRLQLEPRPRKSVDSAKTPRRVAQGHAQLLAASKIVLGTALAQNHFRLSMPNVRLDWRCGSALVTRRSC